MTPTPRRPALLNRVMQAQGLRNLRDRGRISEEEFLIALNQIRQEEGLPPVDAAGESTGGVGLPDGWPA